MTGDANGRRGFSVIVPSELTAAGARRLRLRMRIGTAKKTGVAGVVTGGLAETESVESSGAMHSEGGPMRTGD